MSPQVPFIQLDVEGVVKMVSCKTCPLSPVKIEGYAVLLSVIIKIIIHLYHRKTEQMLFCFSSGLNLTMFDSGSRNNSCSFYIHFRNQYKVVFQYVGTGTAAIQKHILVYLMPMWCKN